LFHQFEDDVRRRQTALRAEVERLQRQALVGAAHGGPPLVLRRRVAEWLHAVANRLEARDAVQVN
jgi:plasmid stabilization system protein ParE